MKSSPLKSWLLALLSEFIEGLADGYLIVTGGATTAAAILGEPEKIHALSLAQIAISMLLAGTWYVAAYVKKSPPPFGQPPASP